MIVSSVSQELDSLSLRLSSVFPSFETRKEIGVNASEYTNQPYGSYYRSIDFSQQASGRFPYEPQEKIMYPRPWTENKGIQCDDLPGGISSTRHSQEARRAVQEYKTRKMLEESARMTGSNYYQEPIFDKPAQKYTGSPLTSSKGYGDQKLRQSNAGTGYKSQNYSKYEDNYNTGYAPQDQEGLRQSRSIKDLYKYKPRQCK